MASRTATRRITSVLMQNTGRFALGGVPTTSTSTCTVNRTTVLPTATATQFSAQPHYYNRWFSSTSAEAGEKEEMNEAQEEKEDDPMQEEVKPKKEDTVSKEEELEAQVKELKNQLLRSLAEQENTRRIASRDVDAAKQFAIKSFARSLLDVSDNLSRALEAVPEEARHDKEGQPVLANLFEGIEMTEKGLMKAFEMNGLIKFGQPGDAFDPNMHQALYEYADPTKEAGTIGQVMKPGFLLNKRVLRPAEVGVVKGE